MANCLNCLITSASTRHKRLRKRGSSILVAAVLLARQRSRSVLEVCALLASHHAGASANDAEARFKDYVLNHAKPAATELPKLTPAQLEGWRKSLKELPTRSGGRWGQGRSDSTLNRDMRCFRAALLSAAGITATTVGRMERAGEVVCLARGLYHLPDAALDAQQSLAEVARLVPKGVICPASALAFHGLTDQLPPNVWIAIGRKDWRPRFTYPPIRIARFL